tara:strand:- start:275 stop:796 length:522 start_codon:yes stop_codon:yes gene_type:complete
MANVLNITYADFGKGKWELATGIYEQQKINGYIDLYTNRLLAELLGVDLYNLFVADLDPQTFVPQDQKYLAIYNAFMHQGNNCNVIISDGMVDMIKGFIYFEYLKDQINQVWVSGNVAPIGENSKNISTLSQQIYTRYNQGVFTYHAIQQYICNNSSKYPTFNGQSKVTTYWI